MQGFNRYIPPDYDPKQSSTLNKHQGKKHALGKRAKDIDKGVLVVRFELPFNIWCGSCGSHIGAGVRYNAQKRKVGNYFSTPIFAFRCKCHLCSGWFEIRTDPKNAAYVVEEGATRKDEDWNPEENGGFAVHDTEAPSAAEPPADPFAHIEKTVDQQTWAKTKTSRLTELHQASDRLFGDPYRVSSALRRKFREEKKVTLEKQGRDDDLRERYGLHEEVDLGGENVDLAREKWEAGRERAGLPVEKELDNEAEGSGVGDISVRATAGTPRPRYSAKGKNGDGISFSESLRRSTAKKYDPFDSPIPGSNGSTANGVAGLTSSLKVKGRIKDPGPIGIKIVKQAQPSASEVVAGGLLSGYGSD
ncbi:hypothetical protein BD324DRAFT_641893 [Kockovaella imperatae]|uniref:CWC16 protein n=1 Tax=Kockovaella imperatae TaxID=4999 RepID=A0A1Y1UIB8_9TREE|nr:hypothetical protein BD324DRAFT_641893 [Kockovaella imperatae]ORX37798.1 hypothetical protein BD324DRAFT_641893 [Kockovaella imperatae]